MSLKLDSSVCLLVIAAFLPVLTEIPLKYYERSLLLTFVCKLLIGDLFIA